MPAAEQMACLADFFTAIPFGQLRPTPEIMAAQPGQNEPRRFVAAARSEWGDLAVIYVPEDRLIDVRHAELPLNPEAVWINPRTGSRAPATAVKSGDSVQFITPEAGDWLLWLKSSK